MPNSSADRDSSHHSAGLLLRVYRPDGRRDEFYVAGGLSIGRSVANSVVLADEDVVDRTHARIELGGDGTARLVCTEPDGRLAVGDTVVPAVSLDAGVRFQIGQTQFECISGRRVVELGPLRSRAACPHCDSTAIATTSVGMCRCPVCSNQVLAVQPDLRDPAPLFLPVNYGIYRADSYVAQGGMGLVLRGTRLGDEVPVAVKVLGVGTLGDQGDAIPFDREVAMLSRVQHKNVVRLLDHGRSGRFPFLALEWIEGPSLRQVIAENHGAGRLTDFTTALRWLEQVARGLAALHAVGIVHRDLKPANILIGPDGGARVADLGVARRIDAGQTAYTATGHVPGTLEYMAPEQWHAPEQVDGRTDLYALGVTFYEVLTGTRPMGAWRPASTTNSTVSPYFDELLTRLLAPRPADRYDDVLDLLVVLTTFGRPATTAKRTTLRWHQPAQPKDASARTEASGSSGGLLLFGDRSSPRSKVDGTDSADPGMVDPIHSFASEPSSSSRRFRPRHETSRHNDGSSRPGWQLQELRRRFDSIRLAYAQAERRANIEAWFWARQGALILSILGITLGGPIGLIVAYSSGDWNALGTVMGIIFGLLLLGIPLIALAGAGWGVIAAVRDPESPANLGTYPGSNFKDQLQPGEVSRETSPEHETAQGRSVLIGQRISEASSISGTPVSRYFGWVGKLGVELAITLLRELLEPSCFDKSNSRLPLGERMRAIPSRPSHWLVRYLGYLGSASIGLSLATLVVLLFIYASSQIRLSPLQFRDRSEALSRADASPRVYETPALPRTTSLGTGGQLQRPNLQSVPKIVAFNPTEIEVAIRQGRYDEAISACDPSNCLRQSLPLAFGHRGVARALKRDFGPAMADCNRAIEIDPRSARAHADRGRVFIEMHDNSAALAACENALELDPNLAIAHVYRSLIRLSSGENDAALADGERAVALAPDLPEALVARGTARFARGQVDEALADCEAAIGRESADLDAYELRTIIFLSQVKYDQAIADSSKLVELCPSAERGWFWRGLAFLRKDLYSQAMTNLNRAIELDPTFALAYNARGLVFLNQADPNHALADYSEAIRLEPTLSLAFSNRALTHLTLRQFDAALADSTKALELDPANAEAHYARAVVHDAKNELAQAIREHGEALRLDSHLELAHWGRGQAFFKNGEIDRALADFDEALRQVPTNPRVLADRALSHQAKGHRDEAIADLRAALQLNPPDADDYRARLKALGSSAP